MHHANVYFKEGHSVLGPVLSGVSAMLVKFTAVAAAVFVAADFMGLPVQDPWFDMFVAYVLVRWALNSVVNGMPEPEETDSHWYIWCYRSMHSLAHISTAYFSHKNMWKYISGMRSGGE